MYTLKGIFPEAKKEQKKNFIRENMKQLKSLQDGKTVREPKLTLKAVHPPRLVNSIPPGSSLCQVKSSPSNKSGKISLNVAKTSSTNARRRIQDIRIKKGDMAEFLKRKEQRQLHEPNDDSVEDVRSSSSSGCLRDIGCQTIESNFSQKLPDTKITMLYPKKENDDDAKLRASGDSGNIYSPTKITPRRVGDNMSMDERPKNRLNSILEKKDNKDPYLPSGYQKGVVPKYIRDRKEQGPKEAEGIRADDDQTSCPPGHITLPDNERKDTLRMLRSSFAELVSELNKLPVKTDTLKMRNKKMDLEKQLAKLEDGIKVFSRPKVFVKIGE